VYFVLHSQVFTYACSDDNVPNETADRITPFVQTGELHLADFDAHKLLGVGSFGEVYRVVHRSSQQTMIMKRRRVSDTRTQLDITALTLLPTHANVSRVYGVIVKGALGELQLTIMRIRHTDDQLHVIVENLDGGSLSTLLAHSGVPLYARSIVIAKDVADGMVSTHTQSYLFCSVFYINHR
jgi:LIM domain kinase 1